MSRPWCHWDKLRADCSVLGISAAWVYGREKELRAFPSCLHTSNWSVWGQKGGTGFYKLVLWLKGSPTFDLKSVFSQWSAISRTEGLAQEQCYHLLMTKTRQSTRYNMVFLGGWQSDICHCRISKKIALNLLFWWNSYHVCTQWNAKQQSMHHIQNLD